MDVSIVIISYNTRGLLHDCLASVEAKTAGLAYEIFVVDNASKDDSCEMVMREFPSVHLIRNEDNRGFARANNQAIPLVRGVYILLLNSDTLLENNAIKLMRDFMDAHPRAAVCGPLLLNADGTVQRSVDRHHTILSLLLRTVLGPHRGHYFHLMGDPYHPEVFDHSRPQRISDGWLTGAVLMIRGTALPGIGLLDENYHFFLEDADWGLAVSHSGWETWFFPGAVVTHLLGGSRKALSEEREILLKVRVLEQERYYVRKNLGLVRHAIFCTMISGLFLANVGRRLIQVVLSRSSHRPLARFKRRLAWELFQTAIGISSKSASEHRT